MKKEIKTTLIATIIILSSMFLYYQALSMWIKESWK